MTEYVELHARSAFSFLEGASMPEHLIQQAANLEMPAMAILDRNGVYGAVRFYMEGQKRGVKAHIGAEVATQDMGQRLRPAAYLPHQHPPEPVRLPLLAESRAGYQNLCRLITQYKLREPTKAEGSALSIVENAFFSCVNSCTRLCTARSHMVCGVPVSTLIELRSATTAFSASRRLLSSDTVPITCFL
jgi:DNA polymerase III alpha subunit